ncbi:MAG: hypothetical protein R2780_01825 [Crocinitomicaceae bacterium]
MITISNYHKTVKDKGIKRSDLNEKLQKGWDFVEKIWESGKQSWLAYESSDKIKNTVDTYLKLFEDFLGNKSKSVKTEQQPKPRSSASKSITKTQQQAKPKQLVKSQPQRKTAQRKLAVQKKEIRKTNIDPNAQKVEAYSEEHKLIKRFVNMDGKEKSRKQVRLFIAALQKAIREKRIRKTSSYAKEIMHIQDGSIKFYEKFINDDQVIELKLPPKLKADYLKILGKQIEMPSVKLIKSYINLQGQVIQNVKAKNLYNRIVSAIKKGKISKRDKYVKEIEGILERLTTFIKKNPGSGILTIEAKTLNGLNGIVGDCSCDENFNGFGRIPDDVVMSSVDVLKLKFDKLGFDGKWLDFIGNPSKNFSMMIFGQPKFGKSILAIAFASYLANNFGTVLYVAREEGIDDTLQEKLEKVAHPDLFVVGSLPDDLQAYDFIFLDSVNKLGMSPQDIDALRARYPDKGFVSIFQTRKDGNFRGSQEFRHDVDIVIELPEIGRAVQYGRYNQGGEMNIFSGSMDGIKKK